MKFDSRYISVIPWNELDERRFQRQAQPKTVDEVTHLLPDGWQALHSDEHDRVYFWHQASGKTTWDMPLQ